MCPVYACQINVNLDYFTSYLPSNTNPLTLFPPFAQLTLGPDHK